MWRNGEIKNRLEIKKEGMKKHTLSVVVPCYNEEATLGACIQRLLAIEDAHLKLEVIIVDDCSKDKSIVIAKKLAGDHNQIKLLTHAVNQGKGAALRTGFRAATGNFVAVQDADLEYDPQDLKGLLTPLINGYADVVLGSRFLSGKERRVLYFWHTLGNKFLTFLSNMFTDLGLTDMETCYKVFKREIIQSIVIEENRFGFEPEIIAKIAEKNVRVYEIGISYHGRTYAEGKKIKLKDGFRALYCVFHYSAHRAILPIQILVYFFIGGTAAAVNMISFATLNTGGWFGSEVNVLSAYVIAALSNYWLCIKFLFKHNARWGNVGEFSAYFLVVVIGGLMDLMFYLGFSYWSVKPLMAKFLATLLLFFANFFMRKIIVFPEKIPS